MTVLQYFSKDGKCTGGGEFFRSYFKIFLSVGVWILIQPICFHLTELRRTLNTQCEIQDLSLNLLKQKISYMVRHIASFFVDYFFLTAVSILKEKCQTREQDRASFIQH